MIQNKVIKGDCVEIMSKMPENSVDLIFADLTAVMMSGINLAQMKITPNLQNRG